MNKVLLIVVVLFALGGAWFFLPKMSSSTQTPTTSQTNTVELKDFSFQPKTISVKSGTTVTITNSDIAGHSVTADDGIFDSGVLASGESTTITFDSPGTYSYHCTPHPNMTLTVVVE